MYCLCRMCHSLYCLRVNVYCNTATQYSDWLRAGRSGDRIPVRRDFPLVQTGTGAHPASCTMGTVSFPRGGKYGPGVTLTTDPLLVLWSWKGIAIALLTLWATTGPLTGTLYVLLMCTIRGYKFKCETWICAVQTDVSTVFSLSVSRYFCSWNSFETSLLP